MTKQRVIGFLKSTISFALFILGAIYLLNFDILVACGFSIMLLIHELGHVLALKILGKKITGLYFIPLLGAFVKTNENIDNRHELAIYKYMGPLVGTIGTLICLIVYLITKNSDWIFLVFIGSIINAVNLIPISFLDGQGVLKGVHKHVEWLGLIMLIWIGFFILEEYSFTLFIMLLFTLFSDEEGDEYSFRWHEVVLSIIYIAGIIVATILYKEYLYTNLVFLIISIYSFFIYIKSTVWNKDKLKEMKPTKLIPLTLKQKWMWSMNWLIISMLLTVLIYYSYNIY